MLDNFTRSIKEKLLIPAAKIAGRYLTANQISILGFAAGITSALCILYNRIDIALIFWALNRILDGLDGTVARVRNQQSDYGSYLDIMLDLILYILIPVAFVYHGIFILAMGNILIWSIVALFAVFYINLGSWALLSALIEKRNNIHLKGNNSKQLTSLVMPPGIIEGTETVVFYTLFYILPEQLIILFFSMSVLTLLGAVQRWIWAVKNLK